MERGLLADHHPADGEAGLEGEPCEVLEEMALAHAESPAEEQASRVTGGRGLAERGEAVLDGGLAAAGRGDPVPAWHPRPHRLNNAPPPHASPPPLPPAPH